MPLEISCSSCGRRLTALCEWGVEVYYDRTCVDRKPAVPKGTLIRLTADDVGVVFQGQEIVGREVYSRAGAIAANPEDAIQGSLQSAGADNGCCGSDGMDGLNRACTCGAMVATE